MSESDELPPEAPSKPDRSLSKGQIMMLVIAVVFVGVGFALRAAAGDATPPDVGPAGAVQVQSNTLTGGSSFPTVPGAPAETAAAATDWSPFFMKGGFSFFLAFCIGYALRTFFKLSAIFIGLAGLLLFGLAKAGVIEPDWGKMEGWFDAIAGRVQTDVASMKDFISGSLPSAGFATLGLVTGFKKG